MTVEFVLVLVASPVRSDGALVDLEQDAGALRELHERIDALSDDVLSDCAHKAGEEVAVIRAFLHEAVEDVLVGWNAESHAVRIDDRQWIATGGWDTDLPQLFWHATALAVSGVTDEPLSSADPTMTPSHDHSLEEIATLLPGFLNDVILAAVPDIDVDLLRRIESALPAALEAREADLQELVRRGLRRARAPFIDFVLDSPVEAEE